jgi:hypothetical protein
MSAIDDLKKLLVDYGAVVIVVGVAAAGTGYTLGSAHRSYWKEEFETVSRKNTELARQRDEATQSLAPSKANEVKLAGDVDALNEKLVTANTLVQAKETALREKETTLREKETALAAQQTTLSARNQEIDRLALRVKQLSQGSRPPPPPPPPPPVTANSLIRLMYRDGQKCIWTIVSELRVANGFVETQLENLREAKLIEPTDSYLGSQKWSCVRLSNLGRAFAEGNGLTE